MEASFWHQRWQDNEIGFHEAQVNPRLIEHLPKLKLQTGDRIFVPLCGKTVDIGWLLSQGYRVVGAELSELAIQQLFEELGMEAKVADNGAFRLYQSDGLDVFVGDIFDLTAERLGPVHAVFDRGALIALPLATRQQYTAHLRNITRTAPQLLITLVYDQSLLPGPPFSISEEEIQSHYAQSYTPTLVEACEQEGGLKGIHDVLINVWTLLPNTEQTR